jgi:hypothetical protein
MALLPLFPPLNKEKQPRSEKALTGPVQTTGLPYDLKPAFTGSPRLQPSSIFFRCQRV